MSTEGKVPILGFAAGAIKWVVTLGFNIGAVTNIPGFATGRDEALDRVSVLEHCPTAIISDRALDTVTVREAVIHG